MVYGFGAPHLPLYKIAVVEPRNFNWRDIKVIDSSLDDGIHPSHGRDLFCGRPVHVEHFPKVMRYTDKKPIPDFSQSECMLMVSPAFKAIVEAIEPGIHQFIPVRYIGTHKVHLADMWFMVICNRIDGIDAEHSNMYKHPNLGWSYGAGRLVFNNAQIGNVHLWRDKFVLPAAVIFISNVLAEAFRTSGLTGFSIGSEAESV
jgi:hypothetical protein